MTNKLKKPTVTGRHLDHEVAREIARAIARGGAGTHSRLAARLGYTSQQLSHRLAGTYARFSVNDLGVCADFFAETQGLAGYGRGWPLLTFEELLVLSGKGQKSSH